MNCTKLIIISLTDGKTVKQFNITSVLQFAPITNEADLKHDIQSNKENEIAYASTTLINDVLEISDRRYTNQPIQEAVEMEITKQKGLQFRPRKGYSHIYKRTWRTNQLGNQKPKTPEQSVKKPG